MDRFDNVLGRLEEAIAARMAHGEDIPVPSSGRTRVRIPVVTATKALLYQAMREKDVSKAELTRRMGIPRQHANRLLDIRHETKLSQFERAFTALGEKLDINRAA